MYKLETERSTTQEQELMDLGTEQLRDGKVKSVMKWYGNEGDCAPKDKNLQDKSFPQNEDTAQHGNEVIAARYLRLP